VEVALPLAQEAPAGQRNGATPPAQSQPGGQGSQKPLDSSYVPATQVLVAGTGGGGGKAGGAGGSGGGGGASHTPLAAAYAAARRGKGQKADVRGLHAAPENG